MAPAGLGRRGERRGFAGRPGGRTSGRPWPQRGCGTRLPSAAACGFARARRPSRSACRIVPR